MPWVLLSHKPYRFSHKFHCRFFFCFVSNMPVHLLFLVSNGVTGKAKLDKPVA